MLPRFLRRPARLLGRLTSGEVEAPRHAGMMLAGALFAATAIYGMALGGHYPQLVQSFTAHSGFAVSDVRVSGNREVSDIDVLQVLSLDGWTSLIGLGADEVRERVVALPWVESATVRKVYPDTLEIALVEKQPFAIWQHDGELSLVERSGAPIVPFASERFASLPLVVGKGAAGRAADIVALVAGHPALAERVRGYVRISDRRWDLLLDEGVVLKLPETGEAAALDWLMKVDGSDALLSRDIASVDLRLSDRLVVQLTPEGVKQREADVKASQKAEKAAGRRT
ncbi:MAG: cell division protein FtsQ/DivIB [Mesorhizobium sp.]